MRDFEQIESEVVSGRYYGRLLDNGGGSPKDLIDRYTFYRSQMSGGVDGETKIIEVSTAVSTAASTDTPETVVGSRLSVLGDRSSIDPATDNREPTTQTGERIRPGAGKTTLRLRVTQEVWLLWQEVWCHLEGVHGGRIRVSPPASNMRFVLPVMVVQKRKRVLV